MFPYDQLAAPKKALTVNKLILFLSLLCVTFILVSISLSCTNTFDHPVWSRSLYDPSSFSATSLDHLVFGIASNTEFWPKRKEYVQLWWQPEYKGCVFLEQPPPLEKDNTTNSDLVFLPPVCISEETSQFRYTYKGGLPSAIRVARVVSETIALNYSNVRWFVFGDDDTVFIPHNLVKTLSKYDHNKWYYIGCNSETWEQNDWFSHNMAFGGGGFAISYPLAKVFANNFDSCLMRYPHLYGSDARISSCLAELGVAVTHEPGFHQFDVRGDIFGLLTAHPIQPLVSLHHLDYVNPIFPNMTTNQALKHLFRAVNLDPGRILQRSVCYDPWYRWTILISWGYAIQVLDHNVLLPDLLPVQQTFKPWSKWGTMYSNLYMFNVKKLPKDPCERPTAFFLENITTTSSGGVWSSYKTSVSKSCLHNRSLLKKLQHIMVFTQSHDLDFKKAPRRQCCDVLQSSVLERLDISIRHCGEEELVFMKS
ncbi:hypothetical protein ACHQM5_025719 [Ranunculus cassubicifolius]